MENLSMELTARECDSLRRVDRKRQLVRDRTLGVALGYQTGCLVYGVGGTGKSFTVLRELEQEGIPHKLWNSHMTGRILFDRLAEFPEHVHVIEDAEQLFNDKTALGVLRSALWGSERDRDGRSCRRITWNAHEHSAEVLFNGGIILLANRRPNDVPEMKASLTRISAIEYGLNFEEVAAEMHRLALAGYEVDEYRLEPSECVEVMEFVVTECRRSGRALELRLLTNCYEDRLQYEQLEAGCHWKDLVASRIRECPSLTLPIVGPGLRQQTLEQELALARELVKLPREKRLAIWQEQTDKSEPTLYRRLAELGKLDCLD